MQKIDYVKLMREGFEEIWNERHRDQYDTYYAPDVVTHGYLPDAEGLESITSWYDIVTEAFPDARFELEEVFGEGDLVAATWHVTATHEGPFMGIEPTGKQATIPGITVNRYDEDKIVETWMQFDALKMLRKMELLPEPTFA